MKASNIFVAENGRWKHRRWGQETSKHFYFTEAFRFQVSLDGDTNLQLHLELTIFNKSRCFGGQNSAVEMKKYVKLMTTINYIILCQT